MSFSKIPIPTFDEYDPSVPVVLPHENVYSIQVGYKLFRLSGLSLSFDSPSFFTRFFSEPENSDKVLFIDRSPQVFEKIYTHLQGYSVNIENDFEFTNLWCDAFYFGLSGLKKILTEQDYFASIGNESFKIPRALLQGEGNYPNYFTINAERLLFDNLSIVERKNMLRPPPQRPPSVIGRSSQLFADLLELLKGNQQVIKNEEHRKLLLKEARYYRFLELEQRTIQHKIVNDCIVLKLEDISKKGLFNVSPEDKRIELPIKYSRPFIDEPKRDLIFQIENNTTNLKNCVLLLNKRTSLVTAQFQGEIRASILQVLSGYVEGLLTHQNYIAFFVGFKNSYTVINGREMKHNWVNDLIGADGVFNMNDDPSDSQKKRKLSDNVKGEIIEIFLKKSMWKLLMRGNLARLEAVSIVGVTCPDQGHVDFL
ncbi:hypothetical protein KGF56_002579 [Candida oxycetoniae]|uniref:Potassium channel tetramerisation-type BTB domain-containing protein n=1 Tax=Candida oxycetoniae TaxID=497107 RepID=A0AAI9WY07_9ASCO|nr:uncharacterized protein KGF56_002579 [Candida oxycetoniae]KAI3404634.2 hypothetical protein KGF56_002579 [Candida oxycetoniae]